MRQNRMPDIRRLSLERQNLAVLLLQLLGWGSLIELLHHDIPLAGKAAVVLLFCLQCATGMR